MTAGFLTLVSLLVICQRHVQFLTEYLSMNTEWVRGMLVAETLLLPSDIPDTGIAEWAKANHVTVDHRGQSPGLIINTDNAVVFIDRNGFIGAAEIGCGCKETL